jgi:hypothetical protein
MALNPMKINDLAADLPFKKEGGGRVDPADWFPRQRHLPYLSTNRIKK